MPEKPFSHASSQEGSFTKGHVYFIQDYDFENTNPPKNKFVLFLNKEETSSLPVLLILPTSQTHYYKGSAFTQRSTAHIYIIKENDVPAIFSKETVLDFNQITEKEYDYFVAKRKQGAIQYMGCLPEKILKAIDQIIQSHNTISPKIKKRIL